MTIDEIHATIRELPPRERLRLVERILHDVIESFPSDAEPSSIIGMMADEPELMDEVCALAMAGRERRGTRGDV